MKIIRVQRCTFNHNKNIEIDELHSVIIVENISCVTPVFAVSDDRKNKYTRLEMQTGVHIMINESIQDFEKRLKELD